MKKYNDDLSLSLLKISREIIELLQNDTSAEIILNKMDERDRLVNSLEISILNLTNPDIILELIRLRDDEKILLEPFVDELHHVRKSLINLKQVESYQNT